MGLLPHKQVYGPRTIGRSTDSVCRRIVWGMASSGSSFGSRRGFASRRESCHLSREGTIAVRIQMDIVGCNQQHTLCGTAGTTRTYVEAGSVKPIRGNQGGPYPNSKNCGLVGFDTRGAPERFREQIASHRRRNTVFAVGRTPALS